MRTLLFEQGLTKCDDFTMIQKSTLNLWFLSPSKSVKRGLG